MSHDTGRKSLLIVEDDETLRSRLDKALRKRGFETRAVSGLAEALDAIDSQPPYFAVVDLRLQDGSGLEVVKALAEQHPAAHYASRPGGERLNLVDVSSGACAPGPDLSSNAAMRRFHVRLAKLRT